MSAPPRTRLLPGGFRVASSCGIRHRTRSRASASRRSLGSRPHSVPAAIAPGRWVRGPHHVPGLGSHVGAPRPLHRAPDPSVLGSTGGPRPLPPPALPSAGRQPGPPRPLTSPPRWHDMVHSLPPVFFERSLTSHVIRAPLYLDSGPPTSPPRWHDRRVLLRARLLPGGSRVSKPPPGAHPAMPGGCPGHPAGHTRKGHTHMGHTRLGHTRMGHT